MSQGYLGPTGLSGQYVDRLRLLRCVILNPWVAAAYCGEERKAEAVLGDRQRRQASKSAEITYISQLVFTPLKGSQYLSPLSSVQRRFWSPFSPQPPPPTPNTSEVILHSYISEHFGKSPSLFFCLRGHHRNVFIPHRNVFLSGWLSGSVSFTWYVTICFYFYFFYIYIFSLETRSHHGLETGWFGTGYVDQDGLRLTEIHSLLLSECWD